MATLPGRVAPTAPLAARLDAFFAAAPESLAEPAALFCEVRDTGRRDELIEPLAGDHVVDAMTFATGLRLRIVAQLLGVPQDDRELVHACSQKLGAANAAVEPGPYLEAREAIAEFRAYVGAMLAR